MSLSKTNSNPRPSSYKFLTRNLTVSSLANKDFQRLNIKRLYLHKLIRERRCFSCVPEEEIYKPLKNNKLFKTLRHVQVSSLYGNYSSERLKVAKNLKSFHIDTYFAREKSGMKRLAFYIKKLPRDVQVINLENNRGLHEAYQDFYKIAKSIRFVRKLESFKRFYLIRTEKHVEKEMMIYSQRASRNKNIKELVSELSEDEQSGFQRAMRRGLKYPGITGLKFSLESSGFPDYEQMRPFFAAETNNEDEEGYIFPEFKDMSEDEKLAYKRVQNDLKRRDEEKEDDVVVIQPGNQEELNLPPATVVPESFLAKSLMREEMKPFYRFELFPDLKMLEITQKNHLYPLGPFVVDGFAALKKLESLKLDIYYRSMGSTSIFKGFLQLPLLKKFFLAINFIKDKDWTLLQHFLNIQDNLEALSIILRDAPPAKSQYFQHNSHLETTIIQCLQNKPFLTSLELKSNYWSLETLSKALSRLEMQNQLHTFEFAGADDTITSEAKTCKRVEGLCNFIKNQKKSLKKLQILLPFVLEESLVIYLADAFSNLAELRELYLSLNYPSKIRSYFENQLQNDIPTTPRKKWNPNLKKYLKRLQNLESFTFYFDIYHSDSDSKQWFFDVLIAFPSLPKLKKVVINTELPATIQKLEEKIDILLQELKNIKNINMQFRDSLCIDETINAHFLFKFMGFNEVQSQRSDLMF